MPNVSFSGISDICQAEFTLSHGVKPSSCHIMFRPQDVVTRIGTLVLTDDTNTLSFSDCAIVTSSLRLSDEAHPHYLTAEILDRRWRWKYRQVSGNFNRRLDDATIDSGTARTFEQIILDVFAPVLGGTWVIVDPSGGVATPECTWHGHRADEALGWLCDAMGYRVILGADDVIYIASAIAGAPVGAIPDQRNDEFQVTPAAIPSFIRVMFGELLVQSKLKLRAVGQDIDGDIKPIDQLSYAPAGGWSSEHPMIFPSLNTDLYAKALAFRTVFRWYQVVSQAEGGLRPHQFPDAAAITSIKQLLPIRDTLLSVYDDPLDAGSPHPAFVEGKFFAQGMDPKNTPAAAALLSHYDGEFTIDGDLGLVKFERPVYQLVEETAVNANFTLAEADLYLTCSYPVRRTLSDGHIRYVSDLNVPASQDPTGTSDVVHRPELHYNHVVSYRTDFPRLPQGSSSNAAQLNALGLNLCSMRLREYGLPAHSDVTWNGLKLIGPNGFIRQVTWLLDISDNGIRTRVGFNYDWSPYVENYNSARRTGLAERAVEIQRIG